jgi:hypothetical protein
MRTIILLLIFCAITLISNSQTTVGIGIYPTGTETGLGFRLNKDNHFSLDTRVTKANLYSDSKTPSSFLSEVSAIYRLVLLEKVRFHIGIGFRGNWNLTTTHKYGVVIPIGVEAFPFPFQNAGLFFEAAPFFETDSKSNWQGGIRTVAGFVFYFPKKLKKTINEIVLPPKG